jgi:hypothetical protein
MQKISNLAELTILDLLKGTFKVMLILIRRCLRIKDVFLYVPDLGSLLRLALACEMLMKHIA